MDRSLSWRRFEQASSFANSWNAITVQCQLTLSQTLAGHHILYLNLDGLQIPTLQAAGFIIAFRLV